MKKKITVYWSRRDFRLEDNPALFAATKFSKKESSDLLPIFILEDYMINGSAEDQFGYPSRLFLTKALPLFAQNFDNFTVIKGKAVQVIKSLSKLFDITIFVNEDVYLDFYTQLKKLREADISIKLYSDALTVSKETKTGNGNRYSVFTPFKNAVWNEFCGAEVLPKVNLSEIKFFKDDIDIDIKDLVKCDENELKRVFSSTRFFKAGEYVYNIDDILKAKSDYAHCDFSEASAIKRFDLFLKNKISLYKNERDTLDIDGTSKMSTALAWGLVSSRFLQKKIQKKFDRDFLAFNSNPAYEGPVHYISELIWREFYKYLLYHNPELMHTEFQEKFRKKISWVDVKIANHRFISWMQGETGYPIVDAAMMELAKTGYMHNRARMIVASVLTKNLGVDWVWGQEYFRAMLIDLDEASNNGGWQWAASVGPDPKPIRIFNPYLQADNYDKNKSYQIKFLREDYFENPPELLIEHKKAREEALDRYGLSLSKDIYPRDY